MRKVMMLGALLLSANALAATPRQVVNQIASDLNLVQQGSKSCNEWAAAGMDFTYPALRSSSEKYITTLSFIQKESLGVSTLKSLFEIYSGLRGFESTQAWESAAGLIARTYKNKDTKNYNYGVAISEEPNATNPYLKTAYLCISITANRPQ